MRRFWVLILGFTLFSCQYFLSKEERTTQLVNSKLAEIDMNDVDQYPLFEACDETATKEEQRQCFQNEIMKYFETAIEDMVFRTKNDLADTLWVDLRIDEEGRMAIAHIFKNNNLDENIPELRSSLSERLNDSTKIAPAIKRGVPVGLKVRLPILIETRK